jgi:hypothetical protein
MSASENQSTEVPATDFTRTWRYKVGFTMIVVGNLGILLALAMPALGAGTSTVGAMVLGGEALSLGSIIFLGKAGFKAIKSKFVGAIKTSYTGTVGKTRHYIGIVLLCANVVTTFTLALYAWDSFAAATPKGPHPIVWGLDLAQQATMVEWLFLIGEINFLIAIYMLGADWWGKFRRIFVWEAPAD